MGIGARKGQHGGGWGLGQRRGTGLALPPLQWTGGFVDGSVTRRPFLMPKSPLGWLSFITLMIVMGAAFPKWVCLGETSSAVEMGLVARPFAREGHLA